MCKFIYKIVFSLSLAHCCFSTFWLPFFAAILQLFTLDWHLIAICHLARQTGRQKHRDTAWIGFDLSEISRCRIARIDWNYYKSLSISRICIENVNGENLISAYFDNKFSFNLHFHTLLAMLLFFYFHFIWSHFQPCPYHPYLIWAIALRFKLAANK